MNKLRMLALACGITLAGASGATAQDKAPPIQKKTVQEKTYDDLRNSYQRGGGGYRFVSGDETLTSGDLVTIARKEGKITGVFVYADPKSNKLMIRPKAGQPPVGIPEREIERIERITPAVGPAGKGGIRPAIEQVDKTAPSYEIHTMIVRNGPYTSTFFYDDSLSPGERDQLRSLEKASNDIVQKGMSIETLRQAMDNAANDPGVDVVQTGGPAYPYLGVNPYFSYDLYYYLYYPVAPALPYYGFFPGYYGGGGSSTVVVRDTGSSAHSLAALSKTLTEAETALANAQKQYTALSQRAVYDSRGHIVAVRLEQ